MNIDGWRVQRSFCLIFLMSLTTALTFFMKSQETFATSQWARKYETPCSTCHTVFPRLNYYGERFMRNGFQDPDADESDGGTLKKKEYGRLNIGQLEDYFGVRISVQPIRVRTKGLTKNRDKHTRVNVGRFDWIQLFTAGTIIKDISFFNELEVDNAGTVKHGWFYLGFHNLVGPKGWVNFQIGKISPLEWTSFSNRLRIFPEVQALADKIKSSNGIGDDSVDISSSQFGINYYGYEPPFVWALGTGSGKNADNANQFLNTWGSLRLEVPESANSSWEGSSASLFAYRGTDTTGTATVQRRNDFWRFVPSVNLRWGNFDVIQSFLYGAEDNFTFSLPDDSDSFWGITTLLSYLYDEWLQAGVQYDMIRERDADTINDTKLIAHLSMLFTENIQSIFTASLDLRDGDSDRNNDHEFFITLRSMF